MKFLLIEVSLLKGFLLEGFLLEGFLLEGLLLKGLLLSVASSDDAHYRCLTIDNIIEDRTVRWTGELA